MQAEIDADRQRAAANAAIVRRQYHPLSTTGTRGGYGPVAKNDLYRRMAAGLAETDRMFHLKPGTSAALINAESSFRTLGSNEYTAAGIGQFTDPTWAGIERALGRKMDRNNPDDVVAALREEFREAQAAGYSGLDFVRWHHGGSNTRNWGPKGEDEVAKVEATRGQYGAHLPPGAAQKQRLSEARLHIDGMFQLMGPTGTPAAVPIIIQKQVGVARPSGM
jgi:hypothetical protein